MKRTRIILVLAVVLALALGVLPAAAKGKPAHAGGGKGNKETTSSSEWVRLDQESPSHGDTVTFSVSNTDSAVRLQCSQNEKLVYQLTHSMSPDYLWVAEYTLWSPSWTSGEGDCTAEMGTYAKNGRWNVLASTSFHVAA